MDNEGHKNAGRSGSRWRKTVEIMKRTMAPVCHVCSRPIDPGLHYLDPWSWTAEHVQPLSKGGDPYDLTNLRPAHRRCNLRKGTGNDGPPPTNTRRW